MNMYRYILLDIDGTMLNFEASEDVALRYLFDKYGFGELREDMKREYIRINRGYWEALERKEMTKEQILVGRFHDFFAMYGLDVNKASAFNDDYQIELGNTAVFERGAEELVHLLKGKVRVLGATNGTKVAQERKLKLSGLDQILDYTYISEDLGYEKPDIRYFEHIFEKEGITDPKEVLIVGDSLSSDIRGGIDAGIDTCWYNPNGKKVPEDMNITYVISDLNELKGILGL